MPKAKFKIKFSFQERRYVHEVSADTEYEAMVVFWEEIKRKMVVEKVEREDIVPPQGSDNLDYLLNIFGMKK